MLSLEALILFDMLAAHQNTLSNVRALVPDRDSASAIAARYGYLVAQRDLFKALHTFAPGQRLVFGEGRGVAADSEGGLHWKAGNRPLFREDEFSRS